MFYMYVCYFCLVEVMKLLEEEMIFLIFFCMMEVIINKF